MVKKISVFMMLYMWLVPVYATGENYPLDTIALDEALKQIVRVNGKNDSDLIENAQAELFMYFMENSQNGLPASEIVSNCKRIVQDNVSCMNFFKKYNAYLDHANFCIRANQTQVIDTYGSKKAVSFRECAALDPKIYNHDGTVAVLKEEEEEEMFRYRGDSVYGQCISWIDSAQKCVIYLDKYYTQKLSEKNISTDDKIYYECLLNKVKVGLVDFPMSNIEQDCKNIQSGS